MIAIDPLEWPGVNMAFLVSFFGAIAMTLAVIPYGKRRPVGKPVSWGEAMLGAAYAFFTMFVAFGVAPHQWIDHADKNLGWSKDKIIYGPGGFLKPTALGGFWNPITLQYEAVRDIVVVLIHVVYFGLIIFIWKWWQSRGETKPSTEVATSTFGRPLVRKS
ncbi:hypothetical protein [Desertimonas flava]|jgi:hypothetical protein|uniref:hypothetical protein n=1 Tax=Desertimonas flava TaxID=2064846 RepID=UPI0013C4BD82|nr:hypothetical protein [Desertimonas flava]